MKLSKVLLKEKINSLEHYYKQYPHKKRIENIEQIELYLDNQEYKIAVVANMSSGKSTFINALFGEDVLPAFNQATTDCATFIYSKPNIDKKAIVYFSDKKKPIKIIDNIKEEIKQYAQKDAECENKKHKNVEKIELYYPFKNIQTSSSEDFSITFIDTPGPNSTGEDYKQKHKDQTRSVLNDVDLALFMFDFGQTDANLGSDEQGLWHTIKKRHDKDKNFDVYLLLNKIDMALEDNDKIIKEKYGNLNREKFYPLKIEWWNFHENKAIEKLKKAAIKHGIEKPKIYPISSKYQLLLRNNDDWKGQEYFLEPFQRANFRNVFDKNWEDEFIEYIGISKLEKDMNNYINESVKDKILLKIDSQINGILDDENKDLELRLQTLQKPQEEAEKNLKKADKFLHGRAKEMQDEMKKESLTLENKYIKAIKAIIDNAIEEELTNNIDEMAKKTIAFTQAFALDNKINLAIKKANKNFENIDLDSNIVEIEINKEIDKKDVMQKMQEFMQSIFEDYKRNYLDLKSDIKEAYFNFKIESDEFILKYKNELDKELESSLDVKMKNLETQSIDYDSMLTLELQVPSSVLDYDFNEYQTTETKTKRVKRGWYNPARWFGDKYTTEKYDVTKTHKTHSFRISPSELRNSIKESMEESIAKFANEEKKIHTRTIENHLSNNTDVFQDFRHEKVEEIKKLKKEIEFMEENLEKIQTQYSEFNKLKKDK
jgi:GTPase Era involved in 16S rRNA processing